MSQKQVPRAVDPAVQAARITRTGAIVGVVLAALITGTATGVAAYFTGRKDGVQAAATTVYVTVGQTDGASAVGRSGTTVPASGTRPGPDSLLDLNPVESVGPWQPGGSRVNATSYEQVITGKVTRCYREDVVRRIYQLDRKYRNLHVQLGLSDGSADESAVVFRFFVDKEPVGSATTQLGVGVVQPVDVDLTGAFRLTVEAQWVGEQGSINCRSAEAVWIEPALS